MATATARPLTIDLAAKKAGVTPRTVWNWIHDGLAGGVRLKASKLGAKWVIERADLEEFSRRLAEAALARRRAKA